MAHIAVVHSYALRSSDHVRTKHRLPSLCSLQKKGKKKPTLKEETAFEQRSCS